jgi:hypothetical protein
MPRQIEFSFEFPQPRISYPNYQISQIVETSAHEKALADPVKYAAQGLGFLNYRDIAAR